MNIAVIRLKDIVKYLVGMVIIVIVITGLARFFNAIFLRESNIHTALRNHAFTEVLDMALPLISYPRREERGIRVSGINSILTLELRMLSSEFMRSGSEY